MPIRYTILTDIDLCYAEWRGSVSPAAVIANLESYLADPLYRPGRPELIDASGVTEMSARVDDHRSHIDRANRQSFPDDTGTLTVIIATTDFAFGHARQYQTLASMRQGIDVRVFREERDALRALDLAFDSVVALMATQQPVWRVTS